MNIFKTQNGDIINFDYIVGIKHNKNPSEYIVYLRDKILIYISEQDYNELCAYMFSPKKLMDYTLEQAKKL